MDLVQKRTVREPRLEMFWFIKQFWEAKVQIKVGEQDCGMWVSAVTALDRALTITFSKECQGQDLVRECFLALSSSLTGASHWMP